MGNLNGLQAMHDCLLAGGKESKLHVTPIKRYSALLQKYIGANEDRQFQALIVAERLSHAQDHPSGK